MKLSSWRILAPLYLIIFLFVTSSDPLLPMISWKDLNGSLEILPEHSRCMNLRLAFLFLLRLCWRWSNACVKIHGHYDTTYTPKATTMARSFCRVWLWSWRWIGRRLWPFYWWPFVPTRCFVRLSVVMLLANFGCWGGGGGVLQVQRTGCRRAVAWLHQYALVPDH